MHKWEFVGTLRKEENSTVTFMFSDYETHKMETVQVSEPDAYRMLRHLAEDFDATLKQK